MDQRRVNTYFHCRPHSDWSVVDDSWCRSMVGDESMGYALEWASKLMPGGGLKVRYRVWGGVLMVACCERVAAWLEHAPQSLNAESIMQDLMDFFAIEANRAHIPQLIADQAAKLLPKY